MNKEENGKVNISKIALSIGLVNWIIVIITIFSRTSPQNFSYLFYSFIPALISITLTVKVNKGYRVLILIINILFILFYIIGFLYVIDIARHV